MPPNNTPFRPFETNLDQSRALAILRQAVAGGDDGELYLERHRSEFLRTGWVMAPGKRDWGQNFTYTFKI